LCEGQVCGPSPVAGTERGADEFLTKPVDLPKLRQNILAVKADAMGATDDRATSRRDN
jgi:DNA-binding response OmpR family regulator